MRGSLAVAAVALLASLSGCVSMVEEGDPDLDVVAAEAQKAIDDYEARTGHIAGTVRSAVNGTLLTDASVDLRGVAQDVTADAQGRFVFLDLAPGPYNLTASAPGFLDQQVVVDVVSGQFARPSVVLEPIPAPPVYFTTMRMDAYSEAGILGFESMCYCQAAGEFDAEGLTELVIEAVMGESASPMPSPSSFSWRLYTYDAHHDYSYVTGYGASPLQQRLLATDLVANATHYELDVQPDSGLMPHVQQLFTAYLTAFYNGPAPADFTAVEPA